MKLLVAVKRVIDFNARVRVKPDKVGRENCRAGVERRGCWRWEKNVQL